MTQMMKIRPMTMVTDSPIYDEAGHLTGVVGISVDVTGPNPDAVALHQADRARQLTEEQVAEDTRRLVDDHIAMTRSSAS